MKFLFIYHGGDVPAEHVEQNVADLWRWIDRLKDRGFETVRFAGNGVKTVSENAVLDYEGKVFGISIIEADSLDEALALTQDWPELEFGGKIDILQAK